MNRNLNSHFSMLPRVNIKRSKMDRPSSLKTSFNVGDVIPIYLSEVLPGSTHQLKTNLICRMQPLVTAPLDDLYLDTMYFFVPNRLVWNHWKEFNGENTESAWYPTVEYSVPQLVSGTDGFEIGSIADYFGLPIGVPNLSVSALPFRAYSLIMNEWFRSEAVVDPLETPVGDAQQTYYKISQPYNPAQYANGGKPFIAAKSFDYFTSGLPSPQRSADVSIGLAGDIPVLTKSERYQPNGLVPMTATVYNNNSPNESLSVANGYTFAFSGGTVQKNSYLELDYLGGTADEVTASAASYRTLLPDNLYASLGDSAAVSINQLRQAIALQQLYEIDARNGGRYTSILKGHFGVDSPDGRLQRPEYLGGNRISINVNQVIQQSASTEVSPQGNIAGYSLTSDSHGDFIKSFTEHGYIIGVAVARYSHTYQQGVERHWSRKGRWDFYWPALANIGEQAILNKEIFAQGTAADDEVFAYQEAWSEYRYRPSRVTSEMRSNHANTLDSWHFADDYDSLPMLSSGWLQEDKNNVDRALAVTSEVSNQLFADFYFQDTATLPMPVYSVPGLERI